MAEASIRTLGGRYRLERRIGDGGFGAVYRARDVELQRQVAIKLLDPATTATNPAEATSLRERFQQEAIATAAIDHPNVVRVYDVGFDEREVYIVMELLLGQSLADELQRWPTGVPPARALKLFVGALEGLAAGHAAGIVHKDLKPDNLFLSQPGTDREKLCIIDFGVASVLHEQRLTATGKLVGTPRYLAPEYIEHLHVTPAVDVYQMGLILVEMLCAMPCVPRRLDLVTCCQRHVDGALTIPPGLLDGQIGKVITKAVAVNPEDRYPSAQAFATALALVDPDLVSTAGPGQPKPTPRLGVKPLNRATTQPMHGGADVVPTEQLERREAKSGPATKRRHARTGPTKRLGPTKDILEQLEAEAQVGAESDSAPEEVELPAKTVSPGPNPTVRFQTPADITSDDAYGPAERPTLLIVAAVATIIAALLVGAYFAFVQG